MTEENKPEPGQPLTPPPANTNDGGSPVPQSVLSGGIANGNIGIGGLQGGEIPTNLRGMDRFQAAVDRAFPPAGLVLSGLRGLAEAVGIGGRRDERASADVDRAQSVFQAGLPAVSAVAPTPIVPNPTPALPPAAPLVVPDCPAGTVPFAAQQAGRALSTCTSPATADAAALGFFTPAPPPVQPPARTVVGATP